MVVQGLDIGFKDRPVVITEGVYRSAGTHQTESTNEEGCHLFACHFI